MAAPFRRAPATPNFGERTYGPEGNSDPFLPPPRPPADEVSMYDRRDADRVTLGKPLTLRPLEEEYQLTSTP